MKATGIKRIIAAMMFSMLAFGALQTGTAEARNYRMTIGSGHPIAMVWVNQLQNFFCIEVKKRVAERTNHTIEWNYAWAGSVAKLGENLEMIQDGLLDMGLIGFPFEPAKLGLHNFAFYTPFGSSDAVLVNRVGLQVMKEVPYLTEVFEKKYNQKFLGGAIAVDSYHFITKFPWKTLDDLKGVKIAAAGPNLSYINAVDGIPVQSNLPEAYTSLQTGVYDGWIMFRVGVVGFKLYEIAPYYKLTDFGATFAGAVTINLDRWKSLPKDVQDIIAEVSREYSVVEAKAVMAKEKIIEGLMTKKLNVKTSRLSKTERAKWAKAMANIPNKTAKSFDAKGMPGTKVFKTYIRLMEEGGYRFPRKWNID